MTGTGARLSLMLAVWLPLLASCRHDLTQVALVVQSDLNVPNDVDAVDITAIVGASAPPVNQFFVGNGIPLTPFPLSVGFESGGTTNNFSVTVRLFTGASSTFMQPTLVISRTVTDVRFVPDKTMMLVLPMNRECACVGTTCPSVGNPRCDNIDKPSLQDFDPAIAPPSSMTFGGTGGAGGIQPPVFDAAAR